MRCSFHFEKDDLIEESVGSKIAENALFDLDRQDLNRKIAGGVILLSQERETLARNFFNP